MVDEVEEAGGRFGGAGREEEESERMKGEVVQRY